MQSCKFKCVDVCAAKTEPTYERELPIFIYAFIGFGLCALLYTIYVLIDAVAAFNNLASHYYV